MGKFSGEFSDKEIPEFDFFDKMKNSRKTREACQVSLTDASKPSVKF